MALSPEEDYASMVAALDSLPHGFGAMYDESKGRWLDGSRAEAEAAEYPDAVQTAYAQAFQSITVAGDNIGALVRALTQPVLTVAPWVLGRTILESAAGATWLVDLDIDAKTRVSRSMSLRLSHLRDEATYLRSALKEHPEAAEDFNKALPQVEQRIDELPAVTRQRGIDPTHDKTGKLIGFAASTTPSFTDLADYIGEESNYRLLSGLAHGRIWAFLALAGRYTGRTEGRPTIEQYLSANSAIFLIAAATEWFSKPTWNYAQLMGWDLERVKVLLEQVYDQIRMVEELRFWRR